jgi:hypothetical protein
MTGKKFFERKLRGFLYSPFDIGASTFRILHLWNSHVAFLQEVKSDKTKQKQDAFATSSQGIQAGSPLPTIAQDAGR